MNVLETVSFSESPWIQPKRVIYENDQGEVLKWDYIERTHSQASVLVMPRFKASGDILFVRQYRVIFDRYVIGFPAGVLDDDDVEACALRELKEETGYVGKVVQVSPALALNSALVKETGYCVVAELEENVSPQQQGLEPSEKIEMHRVKKDQLGTFFERAAAGGDIISGGPWFMLVAPKYV